MKVACLVLGTVLLSATIAHVHATRIVDWPHNRTQVRSATTVPIHSPVLRRNRSSRLQPNATSRFTLVPVTSSGNHSTVVFINATTAMPFNASVPSHTNASSWLGPDANATAATEDDDDMIVAPWTWKLNSTTNVTTASHACGTNGVAALITLITLVVALGLC